MSEMTPKVAWQQNRQIDYHADTCGRMTAIAVMQDLGNIQLDVNEGTVYDRRFFELCEMLAEGKDQAFLDEIDPIKRVSSDKLHATREVVERIGLAYENGIDDRRNENAFEYLRGVTPNTTVGSKMLEICDDSFINHYRRIARGNLQHALECSDDRTSYGLGIPSKVGVLAFDAKFYAEHFYRNSTSV